MRASRNEVDRVEGTPSMEDEAREHACQHVDVEFDERYRAYQCQKCFQLLTQERRPEYEACLDHRPKNNKCRGAVEYRMALSATGRSFPRCDGHWHARLDQQEGINKRYPDTPNPPADFDPTYAGERWDEDY